MSFVVEFIVKIITKAWWVIPIALLCGYIWYQDYEKEKLSDIIEDKEIIIKDKNGVIKIKQEKIALQCKTIGNQKTQIQALKEQDKKTKIIEKHYYHNQKENNTIIKEYEKTGDSKKVLMRIKALLPGGGEK